MSIDPRPAFVDGAFVTALTGVAGLARVVRELAGPTGRPAPDGTVGEPDDFVDLLLGVASLGAAVEGLVPPPPPPSTPAEPDAAAPRDWLR